MTAANDSAFAVVFGLTGMLLGFALFRAKDPPMTAWFAPPKVMGVTFFLIGLVMVLTGLFAGQTP